MKFKLNIEIRPLLSSLLTLPIKLDGPLLKGSMSSESYVKRFRDLKRRSLEVSNTVRRIAERETEDELKAAKPRVYQMETTESTDRPVQNSAERRRDKLMGYTMREYENWEKKLHDKEVKKDGANLQELAKYTYEKQLSQFKKHSGLSKTAKISKDQKTSKIKIDDDSQLVKRLVNDLNRTSKERYMAKKKEMEKRETQATPGGYINDKNKQFNQKLDRQLRDSDREI